MSWSDAVANLIPTPSCWEPTTGAFAPARLMRVGATGGEDAGLAAFAEDYLAPALGRRLRPAAAEPGDDGAALRLVTDRDLAPGHYHLSIGPGSVTLTAASRGGFAHGLATLFQLVAGHGRDTTIPCGVITDGPAFGWRGLLLDSGRHFQPVESVLRVIDRISLYKFNVLHWHLTEDQGWRLEVPGLPRLTSVGAWRDGPAGGRHGGFYTAADVRRVVTYADARGVTVVPEIEMPGHCQAALAAYPELSCTGGPFAVQTQWGVFADIYCAGNDQVFSFLETVLAHVLDLFPSPFIHVGGDEAPKGRWRACPRCQARLEAEGLGDEAELQSWFVRRIGRWLSARGRRLVGWDEILEGGLAGSLPDAVVQSWRGFDGARAAVAAGHDTVVSPTSHAYFDYDPGALDLAQVLRFDPVPSGLTPDRQARVLGGAANLWTEYVPSWRDVDRQLFPRLPAMAEALWARPPDRDAAGFLARVRRHEPVFAALDIRPGFTCRPLRLAAAWNGARGHHAVRWTTEGQLARAVAGREPDVRCAVLPEWSLSAPGRAARPEELPLPEHPDLWRPAPGSLVTIARPDPCLTVLLQLMVAGAPCGAPEVVELCRHLALGRPVKLAPTLDPGDASRLTDGVLGTWRRDDGRWYSCAGADLDAVIYLGKPVAVGLLLVRFLQDANARIFPPREVRFQLSADGRTWRDAGDVGHDVPDRLQDKVVVPFAARPTGTARFVRVHAVSRLTCPDWHPDAGQPCWLYADEIVVRDQAEPRSSG